MWFVDQYSNTAFSWFASIWMVTFWLLFCAGVVWGIKALLDATEKHTGTTEIQPPAPTLETNLPDKPSETHEEKTEADITNPNPTP